MKKILLPLALFAIIGCNGNDEEREEDQPVMMGMWKMNKVEAYKSSIKKTETKISTGCSAENTHEFRWADMTTVNYAKQDNGCVPYETVTRKYTYDQKNKKFWYEGEKDYPYIVSQLTSTSMIFESYVDDIDNDGINDVVTYYFERIK